MQYAPSTHIIAGPQSVAAVLHTAADIVALDPTSPDAVADAGRRLAAGPATVAAADRAACRIAAGRHPHQTGTDWAGWQHALAEPWPILVDAAAHAAAAGEWIEPGRWSL